MQIIASYFLIYRFTLYTGILKKKINQEIGLYQAETNIARYVQIIASWYPGKKSSNLELGLSQAETTTARYVQIIASWYPGKKNRAIFYQMYESTCYII